MLRHNKPIQIIEFNDSLYYLAENLIAYCGFFKDLNEEFIIKSIDLPFKTRAIDNFLTYFDFYHGDIDFDLINPDTNLIESLRIARDIFLLADYFDLELLNDREELPLCRFFIGDITEVAIMYAKEKNLPLVSWLASYEGVNFLLKSMNKNQNYSSLTLYQVNEWYKQMISAALDPIYDQYTQLMDEKVKELKASGVQLTASYLPFMSNEECDLRQKLAEERNKIVNEMRLKPIKDLIDSLMQSL